MGLGDLRPHGHLGIGAMMEQIRVDLRHHVERNPVLQRKQIVQMPIETSAPEHLEIEHDVQQRYVHMDLVVENLDGTRR